MAMPNMYVIAGCNGAGKTTASFTLLPELLGCREYVNADEIARGLSPFNPEAVQIAAGKIMLSRLQLLLKERADFGFETTLSSHVSWKLIQQAQQFGYHVTVVFFWLNSLEMALQRVAQRISEGGHSVPLDLIERRYYIGIERFKSLCEQNIPDSWILVDNSDPSPKVIGEYAQHEMVIHDLEKFLIFTQS